jgi:hypothetical protein
LRLFAAIFCIVIWPKPGRAMVLGHLNICKQYTGQKDFRCYPPAREHLYYYQAIK